MSPHVVEVMRIKTSDQGDELRVELLPVGRHGAQMAGIVQYRPDRFGDRGLIPTSKVMMTRAMINDVIDGLEQARTRLQRRPADTDADRKSRRRQG